MNIGKSFSFPFEDRQWISKLGLGAVITMIPILNFAWTGYMVDLLRNVMDNKAEPLPNWDDIGKKFTDGLMVAVAGFIYALPILVVFCLPLSFMIVPAILAGDSDFQGIANAIAGLGSLLLVCLSCVFAVYALFLSVIFPAILIIYAREGTLASCFKFRDAIDLVRQNSSPFLTAWGMSILANIAVGFIVSAAQLVLNIIPCVGQLASLILTVGVVVYATSVYAHLFGQFGNMAFGGNQPSQS